MCLGQIKKNGRVVACGAIEEYNEARPQVLKNYKYIIMMQVRMQGFVVSDYRHLWPQARMELAEWSAQGKLKAGVTFLNGGLDVVQEALVKLFEGVNTGKLLVKVKDFNESPAKL